MQICFNLVNYSNESKPQNFVESVTISFRLGACRLRYSDKAVVEYNSQAPSNDGHAERIKKEKSQLWKNLPSPTEITYGVLFLAPALIWSESLQSQLTSLPNSTRALFALFPRTERLSVSLEAASSQAPASSESVVMEHFIVPHTLMEGGEKEIDGDQLASLCQA